MTNFASLDGQLIRGATLDAAFATKIDTVGGDASAARTKPTGASAYGTLADFLGDISLARSAGIIGDGSTVTTSLWRPWLSTPGTKILPPGVFVLNDLVSSATDGVRIIGAGPGATTILQTNSGVGILNLSGLQCSLENLTLAYSGTPTAGAAVQLAGLYGRTHNIAIGSCWDGILATAGGTRHTDLTLTNYENTALTMQSTNDCFLANALLNAGNTTRGRNGGILLKDKAEAFIVESVDILLGVHSIQTAATVNSLGSRPFACRFNNMFCDSSGAEPALFDSLFGSSLMGCWFSGGRTSGAPKSGAVFTNCLNLTIGGGTQFHDNGDHGAVLSASCRYVVFDGAQFTNNSSTTGTGVSHGLIVTAGTTDFIVANCIANDQIETTANLQAYGIYVASGASNRYTIGPNSVLGNYTGGVFDGGTGANKTVAGNY